MSAIDVANYLKQRIKRLNLSTATAARLSGLSRQTWHKLLNAEIEEARLSTLVRVAETLHTLPTVLIALYFNGSATQRKLSQCSDPFFYQDIGLVQPGKGF